MYTVYVHEFVENPYAMRQIERIEIDEFAHMLDFFDRHPDREISSLHFTSIGAHIYLKARTQLREALETPVTVQLVPVGVRTEVTVEPAIEDVLGEASDGEVALTSYEDGEIV